MKNPTGFVIGALLGLAIIVAIAWLHDAPQDPFFHGIRESNWIASLKYNDEDQVKQWRDFGPDGVRVLKRALDLADRPMERLYRRGYRAMSRMGAGRIMRLVPAPNDDSTRVTRMNLVNLLSSLSKDAILATPEMTRALKDEDGAVRAIAITFFTQGEDENCLLNRLDAATKRNLLAQFITAIADDNSSARNNAVIALRYYPDQAQTVVPILLKAEQDPDTHVRRLASDALQRMGTVVPTNRGAR